MASFGDRLTHAWNAFKGDETAKDPFSADFGISQSYRPDRQRLSFISERSIIASIFSKIAVDVSSLEIKHVRVDISEMYMETLSSGLNYCLTEEANIDQSSVDFLRDAAQSLCEWGTIAIVPVDTTLNPKNTGGYDVKTMRVGKVIEWYPRHVKVDLYDDRVGSRKEIILPKTMTAIIENPFYTIMNEPNSVLQRLLQKIALLDSADQKLGAGKLDLIIQLPYVVKNETRREQANTRRKDIENQLQSSTLGIAYTDGSERITQLNRPVENNLVGQVDKLTAQLYNQLGLTSAVFEGTADEAAMTNYYNRTIEPIISAIVEGMNRVFLTKTARSQGHKLKYFRDPFKLVPVSTLAEIGDKFTRNEIMSSNELRAIIGLKAVNTPEANELRNKNMPKEDSPPLAAAGETESEVELQNGV